jgi:hypothetical protein
MFIGRFKMEISDLLVGIYKKLSLNYVNKLICNIHAKIKLYLKK